MSRAFVVPWFEISFIFSKKCQAQGKTAAIRKGFHQFNNEFGFLEFGNSLEKYLAWLDTKRNCWRKFLLHIFLYICVEFLKDVKSLWTSTRKHKKLKKFKGSSTGMLFIKLDFETSQDFCDIFSSTWIRGMYTVS